MNYSDLYKILQACMAVAPKKDIRYFMNGVHMQQENGMLVIEATDGHRLVRFESSSLIQGIDTFDFILDVTHVKMFIDKIKVLRYHNTDLNSVEVAGVDSGIDGHVNFNIDTVKTIDGRFPDCKRYVWNSNERRPTEEIGLDTRYLADLYKITKPFKGSNKPNGIKMELKDTVSSAKFTFDTGIDGLEVVTLIMPCRV